VLLRLAHSPFIFFVPAYVAISCAGLACTILPADSAITAFAGPAVNLALFVTAWLVLKYRRIRSRTWFAFWFITQRINLLLFVLNMLPVPGFDGWKVYSGLWHAFGG
jgi:Zn-dependent protease